MSSRTWADSIFAIQLRDEPAPELLPFVPQHGAGQAPPLPFCQRGEHRWSTEDQRRSGTTDQVEGIVEDDVPVPESRCASRSGHGTGLMNQSRFSLGS